MEKTKYKEKDKEEGAGGHTGFFTRKGEIIHCNYTNNGISTNNESEGYWWFLDESYRPIRYFRPIDPKKKETKKATTKTTDTGVTKVKNENWHATCLYDINVREKPSTSAKIVATYSKGQVVNYDSVYKGNGYMWLSYISYSGVRRYMAYRPINDINDQWVEF